MGSFGSFFRYNGDTIKTDYDQEKLLQLLLHSEALQLRIKKGAAPCVNQLSPWLWPDKRVNPKIPIWPNGLREFKLKNNNNNNNNNNNDDDINGHDNNEDKNNNNNNNSNNNDSGNESGSSGDFPVFIPTIDEVIDISGSRYVRIYM